MTFSQSLKNLIVSVMRDNSASYGISCDSKTFDELMDSLRNETHAPMRNALAIVASRMRDLRTVNVLLSLLWDPKTENNRIPLLFALGNLDFSRKLPELMNLAFENHYEMADAIAYLATTQDPELLRDPTVRKALCKNMKTHERVPYSLIELEKRTRPLEI